MIFSRERLKAGIHSLRTVYSSKEGRKYKKNKLLSRTRNYDADKVGIQEGEYSTRQPEKGHVGGLR
jgi:hypothetical protein